MRYEESYTNGRWYDLLTSMGIDSSFLKNKHGPCPLCGGVDRFRWDNREGRGSFICSGCGAGDGVDLICRYRGWDFREFWTEAQRLLGVVQRRDAPAPVSDMEKHRQQRRALWAASIPITPIDPVGKYLIGRGLGAYLARPRSELRRVDNETNQIMLARALTTDGLRVATLHRTYLSNNGDKLNRLLMPGDTAEGMAVRLYGQDAICFAGNVLGIAEGIETAIAASILYKVPVWAALTAGFLESWIAPATVKHVIVFGDNDETLTGHAAAWRCAHRNRMAGKTAEVKIPEGIQTDWNDVLRFRQKSREAA